MKKILLILVILPFLGYGQTKNVINTTRIFPKSGKSLELEKALTAHAQKYHTGNWKWSVFEIMSGPDAGGFHVLEGPNSWTDFDSRGDLGKEHTNDWVKNLEPLLTEKIVSNYAVYRDDLSTSPVGDVTEKISINHIYPKPGEGSQVEARIKKLKKVWDSSGQSVAVYELHYSGAPQFAIVMRHKDGWKEKEPNYRKPMKERYEAVYGEGSYEEWLNATSHIDHSWGEMLIMRSDLSSK